MGDKSYLEVILDVAGRAGIKLKEQNSIIKMDSPLKNLKDTFIKKGMKDEDLLGRIVKVYKFENGMIEYVALKHKREIYDEGLRVVYSGMDIFIRRGTDHQRGHFQIKLDKANRVFRCVQSITNGGAFVDSFKAYFNGDPNQSVALENCFETLFELEQTGNKVRGRYAD